MNKTNKTTILIRKPQHETQTNFLHDLRSEELYFTKSILIDFYTYQFQNEQGLLLDFKSQKRRHQLTNQLSIQTTITKMAPSICQGRQQNSSFSLFIDLIIVRSPQRPSQTCLLR